VTALAETAERLRRLGAATLGESGGQPVPPALFPVWSGAEAAGRALTVRCAAGDNLAIHVALARVEQGVVLCVVCDGDPERGYWGEVLTVAAQSRRVAGLVIDAGVRDVAEIEARRFPVFAAVVALRGATKHGAGSVGEPISLRGITVRTGDWVVGDRDGVCVVPFDDLDRVLAAAESRAARESEMFERLAAGATTVELLEIDVSPVRDAIHGDVDR
jgi:4-hydroxy-4-methyl-2-oxoglutarate aldolase